MSEINALVIPMLLVCAVAYASDFKGIKDKSIKLGVLDYLGFAGIAGSIVLCLMSVVADFTQPTLAAVLFLMALVGLFRQLVRKVLHK